jgi:hypothetical protein
VEKQGEATYYDRKLKLHKRGYEAKRGDFQEVATVSNTPRVIHALLANSIFIEKTKRL